MTTLQIFYLSLLQGITEFLPVSSSGHLILLSKFSYFPDQGLALDVAVHVGSILAVMIYFSETIWEMIKGVVKTRFIPNFKNYGAQVFWLIVIGTIPAVIAGFALKSYGMEWLRDTRIIGWTILGYGILLYVADKFSMTIREIKHLGIRHYHYHGTFFGTGTSRSGKILNVVVDSRYHCCRGFDRLGSLAGRGFSGNRLDV